MQRYSINIARKERRGTQMLMMHWARVDAGDTPAHAYGVQEELRKHFKGPDWEVVMQKHSTTIEVCK